jgi:hypothetical protein
MSVPDVAIVDDRGPAILYSETGWIGGSSMGGSHEFQSTSTAAQFMGANASFTFVGELKFKLLSTLH